MKLICAIKRLRKESQRQSKKPKYELTWRERIIRMEFMMMLAEMAARHPSRGVHIDHLGGLINDIEKVMKVEVIDG